MASSNKDAVPNAGESKASAVPDHEQDPATILNRTTSAKTLTISDQHAHILLNVSKQDYCNQEGTSEKKALLKLTLVPFHVKDLACLPQDAVAVAAAGGDNSSSMDVAESKMVRQQQQQQEKEEAHSNKILTFLSTFDWQMTSESGAEYSFHEAFPKTTASGVPDDGTTTVDEPPAKRAKLVEDAPSPKMGSIFKAEMIYPASEHQVARCMPSLGFVLVQETYEIYNTITKPHIDKIVGSGSLSWLQNIVQVKKEKERLLHNADGWILNIDTKWRTHPDALTVPRSEWYQHESTKDLHCLGILKADNVATLRDLTPDHLPLLREMLQEGPTVIEKIYGVPSNQIRISVHYLPQFFHFHVHYTRLENDVGAQVERAHLLVDIIQDLEHDPVYFREKTIVYKCSRKDPLYKLLVANGTITET